MLYVLSKGAPWLKMPFLAKSQKSFCPKPGKFTLKRTEQGWF